MVVPHIIISTLSNYGRQLAFAVAPIPAYLPQYFTLCNTNDPVLQRREQLIKSKISPGKSTPPRKDNDHTGSNATFFKGSSYEETNSNYSNGVSSKPVTEGGFSATSIMILLLSHIFRLQYSLVSAILSTFYQPNGSNEEDDAHKVHFDLVMQSLVMIAMQLLLLSAVTRRRRLSHKKKVYDDDEIYRVTAVTKPRSHSTSSLSQKPFIWMYRPRGHWRWDTVHQHAELILLILMFEYVVSRYIMYPDNTNDYIKAVKNMSVLLESCLALPQIVLNYKRKSTEGLSLVMVVGWVLGDLLKLAYFIAAYNNGSKSGNTLNNVVTPHDESSSSSDMVAFMVGSVFALGLDSVVVLQLMKWYPTGEFQTMKSKLKHSSLLRNLMHKANKNSSKSSRKYSIEELLP